MTAITPDTVIPNPCFIGVRDLLSTTYRKVIPGDLRRIRNGMPHDVRC